MDYTRIITTGRLGKEPDLRFTPEGTANCKFSIAVNGYNDRVDWFNVTCWGKTAENVNQYLQKGSRVLVEGEMRNDKYEKDGQMRDWWHINAQRVLFLDSKGDLPEKQEENVPF